MLIIIGVRDVARDEVPAALADCKKAGITVRMVTGDNLITARAIAEEINLIPKDDPKVIIMEGKDFIEKIGGVVCKKCQTLKC
jgi:Ca2+ transporting ATPase